MHQHQYNTKIRKAYTLHQSTKKLKIISYILLSIQSIFSLFFKLQILIIKDYIKQCLGI